MKNAKKDIDSKKQSLDDMSADDVLRKYDRESQTRIWEGKVGVAIKAFMVAFSLYCIYMTLFSSALPEVRLTRFVAFVIILGYLNYPINKHAVRPNHMPIYDIILMVLGAGAFLYFSFNAYDILMLGGRIDVAMTVIGIIGFLSLAELCRRCVGLPILCVVAALLIYVFYYHLSYNADLGKAITDVVAKLFYTRQGVIGTPTNVCYTYIVLFIIFGAFLERTGIAQFFINFANRVAGWSSGGAAKVAVVSSALCGMVSGSSVGNTVTTGSVTIPMMKKTGYKPEFAGAVEAASSTGGQIMPPIMGAAAFLMAEYTGIPYIQIAGIAIIPALLYFTGIFIAVHLEAKKLGLKGVPRTELPKWKLLGRDCYLMIPLVLLVVLVATNSRTMAYSAAISIFVAMVVGAINFFFSALRNAVADGSEITKGQAAKIAGKQVLDSTLEALAAGARSTVTVAVACAMAGIIAGCITITGLASVLINAIVLVAGDATIIGLILTMLCCIVLGMGVPTTANYCIMASTCAPILITLGIPTVAAHFFVFYFGIVADITPPVALAAYAGSAIAKSKPMKTAVTATKIAIAAFLVPYIFAFNPVMLLQGSFTIVEVVIVVVTALVGLFGIAAGLNGNLFKKINVAFRLALIAGGLCMMIPGTVSDLIGLLIVAGICAYQYLSSKINTTPAQA